MTPAKLSLDRTLHFSGGEVAASTGDYERREEVIYMVDCQNLALNFVKRGLKRH